MILWKLRDAKIVGTLSEGELNKIKVNNYFYITRILNLQIKK